MAKNRNKKKQKQGAVSMDISEPTVSDLPQTMDISESGAQKLGFGGPSRKLKGRPMKRSKNVRKMKAMVKAIAANEKSVEKIMKSEDKASRILSAKLLYD
ncbi:hypothetical protein K2173_010794 [Erythroxylum novogranatense]|uniref:Uncharacterized protein n=1 Tax=Erythroxylum novogranatense TaxID=1862640 RepID=A0AAV8SRL2_9ROSI|nr:hypothetical protein K2173_010794 [Erythroxylum novogranatense]